MLNLLRQCEEFTLKLIMNLRVFKWNIGRNLNFWYQKKYKKPRSYKVESAKNTLTTAETVTKEKDAIVAQKTTESNAAIAADGDAGAELLEEKEADAKADADSTSLTLAKLLTKELHFKKNKNLTRFQPADVLVCCFRRFRYSSR